MSDFIRLVGDNRAVELFGVRLVGVNAENGKKLLFTLIYLAVVILLTRWLAKLTSWVLRDHPNVRIAFWTRQAIHVLTAVLVIVGVVSIWFDNPARLTPAVGFLTAGLAFASQKVVTALAGYFVILRGRTFNVGDRIVMGGVRGDVIALSLMQTTIMEMGQPPPVQSDPPAVWVEGRQYTGHIVNVSNAAIFDQPVYNYTRDFPYLWEEMRLPISYQADRTTAEKILLEVARRHTESLTNLSHEALDEMQRRYFMDSPDVKPKVFYRLTDNWVELTVRFIVRDRNVRIIKDAMSREILDALDKAKIGIASTTFEIVGLPPLKVQKLPSSVHSG